MSDQRKLMSDHELYRNQERKFDIKMLFNTDIARI